MSLQLVNDPRTFKKLNPNDVLFMQGEKAEFIYIVSNGNLMCVKESSKRLTPVLNAQVKSILGIEALSSADRKYSYSVIAREKAEVVPIKLSLLEDFFKNSPELMLDLLKTLIDKITHTTDLIAEHRIVSEKLFSGELFSDEEEARLKKLLSEN